MKLWQPLTIATILLASSAAMASAQTSGGNDSVNYAPSTKTVAGTLPLNTQYTLAVSAPTRLNTKGETALASGILATLRVNATAWPDGSSQAEAQGLVSVVPGALTFYTLGQSHDATVTVMAGAATTPGDYMFTIQADGPSGIGWGNASHTLTVTVSQPVVNDTTPPDVTITSPKAGAAFTFCSGGTTVPVTISASDPQSHVFAIGGTANGATFTVNPFVAANAVVADGQFVAPSVGPYSLAAWATSAGGTGNSPVVGISVKYAMSWLPPISSGRTISGEVVIKFAARDCVGNFVADSSVRVEVWEGTVLQFTAVQGDGSDSVRIQQDDEQYIANFKPTKGVHTFTIKVFFNDSLQASTTVSTR